jgi:hypothetical protein
MLVQLKGEAAVLVDQYHVAEVCNFEQTKVLLLFKVNGPHWSFTKCALQFQRDIRQRRFRYVLSIMRVEL